MGSKRTGAQRKHSAALRNPRRQRHCAVCATMGSPLAGLHAHTQYTHSSDGATGARHMASAVAGVDGASSVVEGTKARRSTSSAGPEASVDAACHVRRKSSSECLWSAEDAKLRVRHCGEGTRLAAGPGVGAARDARPTSLQPKSCFAPHGSFSPLLTTFTNSPTVFITQPRPSPVHSLQA